MENMIYLLYHENYKLNKYTVLKNENSFPPFLASYVKGVIYDANSDKDEE